MYRKQQRKQRKQRQQHSSAYQVPKIVVVESIRDQV